MGNYTREAGFDAIGRGGVALSQHWRDGVHSLFGMQTNGFPNLFVISLIQAGVSFNYTHIVDEQAKHIAYIIGRCVESGAAAVEATAGAVHAWVETIVANAAGNREFLDRCTPGYINREGVRDRAFELNATYAPGPVAYMALLEKWRADGTMDGVAME